MARTIVHRTKTLLDLRAITVMGLSAKPSTDNPIGMFGTGLKYAIATLCRAGGAPVIWIGPNRYSLTAKAGEFRGQAYQQVRMEKRTPTSLRASYTTLPFTTEYGKNWAVWMAYREIESNTRDELGETFCAEEGLPADFRNAAGDTVIAISLPEYVAAWTFADETFLPGGRRARDAGGPIVEAFEDGPRDKLYWRGLRVKDLVGKRTVRAWNFLAPLSLTEDRTLASEWSARYDLARFIATECTDRALIEAVITADDKHWEHRLDWPASLEPSDLFKAVSIEAGRRAYGVRGYIGSYLPKRTRKLDIWDQHPRPWSLLTDDDDLPFVADANGRAVIASPESFDADDWEALMRQVLARVNAPMPPATEEPWMGPPPPAPIEESDSEWVDRVTSEDVDWPDHSMPPAPSTLLEAIITADNRKDPPAIEPDDEVPF